MVPGQGKRVLCLQPPGHLDDERPVRQSGRRLGQPPQLVVRIGQRIKRTMRKLYPRRQRVRQNSTRSQETLGNILDPVNRDTAPRSEFMLGHGAEVSLQARKAATLPLRTTKIN